MRSSSRSCLLIILALLAAGPAGAAETAAPRPRLNVLFLVADDLNCDLGCYGLAGMSTPNIDRLAARGVRFDRAYCQVSLCSPSRTSFLTGRAPNATGILTNPPRNGSYSAHFRANVPDTVTLPQLFKNHGWFAARVGKLYHYNVPGDIGTSGMDDYVSWDLTINPRGRDRDNQSSIFYLKPGKYGGTMSWLADEAGADTDHTDGIGATEAVKLLERFQRESKPFFLAVGFFRPHAPSVAPKKYFDLYPTDGIKLPEPSADDRARVPEAAYKESHAEPMAATDEQRRQAIQAYRASISFMDAQLGRVIDALDRLGLADNTVIVFTSDHGYHQGDHGLWQKQSLFERGARVPLVLVAPGARANGQVAHGLAGLIDLYPTLAALCGAPAPDYLDGISLVPLLEDATATVRTSVITQVQRNAGLQGYSVRSGRWRYTEWNAGAAGRQLYDEESDPAEAANLAADPARAGLVAELAGLLAQERARRGPAPGPAPAATTNRD